jgi:GcrA cell cycle regulator
MSWTKERIDMLTKLASQGRTARQIAHELGDTTRNAVIGQIARRGVHWPNSGNLGGASAPRVKSPPAAKIHAAPRKPSTAPNIQCLPLPDPRADDIARVSFAELDTNHCRFIPGSPTAGGKIYCGMPKMDGSSYCPHHHKRCFIPVGTRPVSRAPWLQKRIEIKAKVDA